MKPGGQCLTKGQGEMSKYDSMPQELKDYANKRIKESGIARVLGHYPVFESKEHVDKWIEMNQKSFEMYFGNDN